MITVLLNHTGRGIIVHFVICMSPSEVCLLSLSEKYFTEKNMLTKSVWYNNGLGCSTTTQPSPTQPINFFDILKDIFY